jgi:3',5'-cyclic AMP phosphodiesterase CpdA
MSSTSSHDQTRRSALKCLAAGSAGTLFVLSAGVLTPINLAMAAAKTDERSKSGTPLFVQISDTHIGFKADANPDVAGTLARTVELVDAMPTKPLFIMHTGDITHFSKAAEFDLAMQLLSRVDASELHAVPGEHDVIDGTGMEFFSRFGKASDNRGYYSFDHNGVHFVGLVNVMNFKPNGLGSLGSDQLEWLEDDLNARSASTPIVVFAHMPLWTVYEPWGWGTGDADQAMSYLRRFGSVTVLNGHVHQIVQKVEGNITFHTARSTAFPQPVAGDAAGPGPLKVPADVLAATLGVTSVRIEQQLPALSLADTPLD